MGFFSSSTELNLCDRDHKYFLVFAGKYASPSLDSSFAGQDLGMRLELG
jgi:hypothetical protein